MERAEDETGLSGSKRWWSGVIVVELLQELAE